MAGNGGTAAGGAAGRRVRIFESYGWRDAADVAGKLKASLEQKDYEVWIDREQMRSDEEHSAPVIEEALQDSEIVITLLSPHSVRGVTDEERETSKCCNEIRVADKVRGRSCRLSCRNSAARRPS